jgi:hypothetical protein
MASISEYPTEQEILLDSEIYMLPGDDLYEKFFLNERRFSPAFDYKHLRTPNNSTAYQSRAMWASVAPADQEGGFAATKKAASSKKIMTATATLKKPKLSDLRPTPPLTPLQLPAPVPASLRGLLLRLPLPKRGTRTMRTTRSVREGSRLRSPSIRKHGTRKIRGSTPFSKGFRGSKGYQ